MAFANKTTATCLRQEAAVATAWLRATSTATRRRLTTLCLDYLAGWPEQYGGEAAVARILCGNVNLQVDDDILNNAVSQRVASVSRKRPHRCLQALASRGSVRWLASENNVGEGERWGS